MIRRRNKLSNQIILKPTMQDKIMGQILQVFIVLWTKFCADCNLDLSLSNMVLALHTLFCYENCKCKIILKSHYTQDKVMGWTWKCFHYSLCTKFAAKFLQETHCLVKMIIFAKLFWIPFMQDKVMDRTQTCFTKAFAQSLSADCDLDLWPSDMVFASL